MLYVMQATIVKLSVSHKKTRRLKETREQGALGERKKDKRRYAEMKRIKIYSCKTLSENALVREGTVSLAIKINT